MDMNLDKIKSYIVTMYPDSTFAKQYADNDHETDPHELMLDCERFFYDEVLYWCDCGNKNGAKRAVRDYLQIVYNRGNTTRVKGHQLLDRFGVEYVYENELLMCLAYTLDAAKLTEHGTSIEYAWITEEGKMFLWLLNQNAELGSLL